MPYEPWKTWPQENGWERCPEGWKKRLSPEAVQLLMDPEYREPRWKECRVRDGIAAMLVDAGAVARGQPDILIPIAEWSDDG